MDPSDARRMVRDLCRRAGVDPDAVLGRDRCRTVARARCAAVLELRRCALSYAAIGRALGRDRSTVRRILRRASVATAPSAPPT